MCGVLVIKRGEVDKAKSRDFNLLDEKLMITIDEEEYRYFGILEYEKEMKLAWEYT